jgi:hypothetical protein
MRSLFKRRLQLQLLFILLAAVLVAALSVLLISDAIQSAEGVVLADADRTLTAAASELDQQYQDRVTADSAGMTLPVPAQDTSLRGVSQAVLRSYPGVEGGYYGGARFLGYSYPTHDTGVKKQTFRPLNSTIFLRRFRKAVRRERRSESCAASMTSSSLRRRRNGRTGSPVGP